MTVVQSPDLDRLFAFEKKAWPCELRATKEQLEERRNKFSTGVFLLNNDEEDVAQVTVSPKNVSNIESFEQMRDLPTDTSSKTLWITNFSASPTGHGYGSKLLAFVIGWAGLTFDDIRTGVTAPGLDKWLKDGKSLETFKNPATRAVLKASKRTQVMDYVEDYWPEDESSAGYGVIVRIPLR